MYYTVNYLFAAYLQTKTGGEYAISRVEKVSVGKAKYFFDITSDEAEKRKFEFSQSDFLRFEQIRRSTIDLAY